MRQRKVVDNDEENDNNNDKDSHKNDDDDAREKVRSIWRENEMKKVMIIG